MAGFLGINASNLNNNLGNVTVGTSAPTADFYFQISSLTALTKEQAIIALDTFRHYILSNGLPAGNIGVDIPKL